MIEDNGLVFTNVNGQSITFNNDLLPLKEFIPEYEMSGVEAKRLQEPGIWPHRTVPGKLLIHTTSDILYNDSASYIAARIKIMNTLIPAGVLLKDRKLGQLKLHLVGQEWMYNDCTIDGTPSAPMQALYPSVT